MSSNRAPATCPKKPSKFEAFLKENILWISLAGSLAFLYVVYNMRDRMGDPADDVDRLGTAFLIGMLWLIANVLWLFIYVLEARRAWLRRKLLGMGGNRITYGRLVGYHMVKFLFEAGVILGITILVCFTWTGFPALMFGRILQDAFIAHALTLFVVFAVFVRHGQALMQRDIPLAYGRNQMDAVAKFKFHLFVIPLVFLFFGVINTFLLNTFLQDTSGDEAGGGGGDKTMQNKVFMVIAILVMVFMALF